MTHIYILTHIHILTAYLIQKNCNIRIGGSIVYISYFILSDMNLIEFPIELELRRVCKGWLDVFEKNVKSIPTDWWLLEESIDTSGCDHYGILTGRKSGITVIDYCPPDDYTYRHLALPNTLQLRSFFGGTHIYYQYEERLNSIYNLLPGISVLNDRSCVFRGKDFFRLKSEPIAKMPDHVVEMLLNAQSEYESNYRDLHDQQYAELCAIIHKDINDDVMARKLICAFRNSNLLPAQQYSTIDNVFKQYKSNYHIGSLKKLYEFKMTEREKRYTFHSLEQGIKRAYANEYASWKDKWNGKKPAIKTENVIAGTPSYALHPRFEFAEGAYTKLTELKVIDSSITGAKIVNCDNRFEIVKKNICSSCKAIHRKGCCERYNRSKRSTAMFIQNIIIKPE